MIPGMILAAGRGERMRPLTDRVPKPLLEVGGKSLLVWQLEGLVQAGVDRVVINTAHLGAQIPLALGDGSPWGARLRYSPEPEGALETAGGIATAQPWLWEGQESEYFALANGDVYAEFSWDPLLKHCLAHWPNAAKAILVMVPSPDHHPRGDFRLPCRAFGPLLPLEESNPLAREEHLTYSGLGVFHRSLFEFCQPGARAALGPLLRSASESGQVFGWPFEGAWVDVGTPERLAALDARLRSARA
ncbi:MAG: hypothetical protein RLY30_1061 [Pseudomonadota bacterium]|jgi:MurNAc alpha-1-phosphate uridylyltransferase